MSPAVAPLRLLTGPAGSGKTHAALDLIRAAATTPGPRGRGAAHPDDALLVLPTYAQVGHLKRLALSRWGVRGLFDRPFTTFTAAGERFLEGFQVRGLPSPEERDRLMAAALEARDPPLFRAISDRPGFRAHLLRLVKELKQTGLEGGEAREHLAASRSRVGRASQARLDAFLEVFEGYEDLLERAGLEDHEDALRRLASHLAGRLPDALPRVLVVDGFDDFTRVEERILHALAEGVVAAGGEVCVTLPWDATRPHLFAGSGGTRERLLALGFEEAHLSGFRRAASPSLAAVAARLFDSTAAPAPGGTDVQMLVAGDAEDEAETVARAVRAVVERERPEGVRGWRDVGVVVRRLEAHAARVESAFARVGVPLRVVGPGEVLASEALARALRGPLAVLAGDDAAGRFEARPLLEWLRWRALLGDATVPLAEVDAWDMHQREHGFAADFDALRAAAPPVLAAPMDDVQAHAARLRAHAGERSIYDVLGAAIEHLAPLPEPSGFRPDGRPRDPVHDRRLARTVAVRARILDLLAALRGAAERTGRGGAATVRAAVTQLTDALEQTTFRPADRRLDAVTLMDAEEARYWELPVVVVMGLEEGSFPLRPREDLLLRDADRRALRETTPALRLPLATDKEARERRLFYGAVTRASVRLVLARRAYDDRGDPLEPSAFLRELEAVVTPTVAIRAPGPGRVARPQAECFTRQDWQLFAAARLAPWAGRRRDVPAAERDLAVAIQVLTETTAPARAARGHLVGADPLWFEASARMAVLGRFAAATREVSASRLKHALTCPHRFFLGYVANLPQDDATLGGPAFDDRQRGRALHRAFELALEHPERSAASVAMDGVTYVGVDGLEARLLTSELERAVELLRDRERRIAGPLVPRAGQLEYAFGGEAPVELGPADCRYRLRGSIDRVDRAPPHTLADEPRAIAAIVDYKRSPSATDASAKAGTEGRDLQLPLYALALEAREGVRVVGLEWAAGLTRRRRIIHDDDAAALFAARREAAPLLGEAHDAFRARLAAAEDAATQVVRQARAGGHDRAPIARKTCAACPWQSICRPDVARLEAALADADDAGEDDA